MEEQTLASCNKQSCVITTKQRDYGHWVTLSSISDIVRPHSQCTVDMCTSGSAIQSAEIKVNIHGETIPLPQINKF
jgi:hypothetical protein